MESYGPWFVALVAFLETCFITGLMVPCGPVIIAAVTLAGEGLLDLHWIAVAAVGGGLAGDSVGYWIGRRGGDAVLQTRGRLGRLARRAEPRARRLMDLHPAAGVTGGRLLSFVRTVMPPTAGFSGLSYLRFVLWDIPGVALWAAAYIGIGLAVDGSWSLVSDILGIGGALLFVALVGLAWIELRRRRWAAGDEVGEEPGNEVREEVGGA